MDINQNALPASVMKICRHIKQHHGTAWLVGGAVRDLVRGQGVNDIDLEVFGLDFAALHRALSSLGRCDCVGSHFGVIKLQFEGQCIDVALPRREVKVASGHRGFSVEPDPHLPPEQAVLRRDFTINAMMIEPLSGIFLDLHGGREDLQRGCLRHVSPAFAEDPLRPLRAMQFAARFRMELHPATASLCRQMLAEAASLPGERVWQEWRKWSQADSPAHGLALLSDSAWLSRYSSLSALQGCPQDAIWHPEGDVWRHTQLTVDYMAALAKERGVPADVRSVLCFAALLHDIAKPLTTSVNAEGRTVSPGHANMAEPLIHGFFTQIAAPANLARAVWHLVRDHMTHMQEPGARAIRRLAARLDPVPLQHWEMLVQADASARPPLMASRPALPWLEQAEAMNIAIQAPSPWVTGSMLLALGMKPGPHMGQLIRQAYDAQLDGVFHSADEARDWCSHAIPCSAQPEV